MKLDKVLVIIPTYNEAENIEIISKRLREAVPSVDILVADDGSPDGTGEIADRLAEADPQIHVMHRTKKEGLGAAYLAGFQWGLDRGYEVLVEMDADGSHQPEQLPDLLAALEDADMVKGSRYVPGGSVVNWPKHREWLSRGGNWWTRLMMAIPVKDSTGGFNAFRADTLRAIMGEITSQGYNFQVDLTWNTISKGMTVAEVPITFIERERGESKMRGMIVVEAMAKTTTWGIAYRFRQLGAGINGLFSR
ncbi:MAG: polyprenol monophosphomannose synthase [Propionibacteriaceae bacterium]|nr:polyprenol monophosphomannose synthase [Propionibacteriaceae bacterium]